MGSSSSKCWDNTVEGVAEAAEMLVDKLVENLPEILEALEAAGEDGAMAAVAVPSKASSANVVPPPARADTTDFPNTTMTSAAQVFKTAFKYDYDTGTPPTMDTMSTLGTVPWYDMCDLQFVDYDIPSTVSSYIQNLASSQTGNVPQWVVKTAITDIGTTVTDWVSKTSDGSPLFWRGKATSFMYYSGDVKEDAYRLDIAALYCVPDIDMLIIPSAVFGIVGVYYPWDPSVEAYQTLQNEVYTSISQLPNADVYPMESDQMQPALLSYGVVPYMAQFGYSYGTPPKKLATDTTNVKDRHWDILLQFQGIPTNAQLLSAIQAHIIPNYGLGKAVSQRKTAITQEILKVMQATLTSQTNNVGSWMPYGLVDKAFGYDSSVAPPNQVDGLIWVWVGNTTVGGTETFTAVYIYWMGTVYDLNFDPTYQDLLRTLLNNIPGSEVPTGHIAMDVFNEEVKKFTRSVYDENNAPDPPYSPALPETRYFSKSFNMAANPTQKDIETQVDGTFWFRTSSPPVIACQSEIYDYIVTKIAAFAGPAYPKENNEWYSEFSYPTPFSYTTNTGVPYTVTVTTAWTLAQGLMVEDADANTKKDGFFVGMAMTVKLQKTSAAADDTPPGF